jgi:hypothetical protein
MRKLNSQKLIGYAMMKHDARTYEDLLHRIGIKQ